MTTRTIQLSEGQDRIVGDVLASGRYRDAGEVVDDALRLLERRQAREAAKMKRFHALIAEGDADLARGHYEAVPLDRTGEWLASLDRAEREAATR